jgi:hypothetical protein
MLKEQIAAWGLEDVHVPATAEAIEAAEAKLDALLPTEIRDLLSETNGVDGEYGLALIWPVAGRSRRD